MSVIMSIFYQRNRDSMPILKWHQTVKYSTYPVKLMSTKNLAHVVVSTCKNTELFADAQKLINHTINVNN